MNKQMVHGHTLKLIACPVRLSTIPPLERVVVSRTQKQKKDSSGEAVQWATKLQRMCSNPADLSL